MAVLGANPLAAQAQAQPQSSGQQIEQLHQALHLSANQEPAWAAYRAGADTPDKTQTRRRAAASLFPRLDAPRRMDLVEAEVRQELADVQRQSQTLKAFYEVLSPDQRRIFDAQTLPPAPDAQDQ